MRFLTPKERKQMLVKFWGYPKLVSVQQVLDDYKKAHPALYIAAWDVGDDEVFVGDRLSAQGLWLKIITRETE
jgi:hypothetical protein